MRANPMQDPAVRRRWRRLGAGLAAGAVGLYLALLLSGNSPPARRAIRARAQAALARHLPSARLGGEPGLDWRLRVGLGTLEMPGRDPVTGPLLRVERVAVTPRWLALLAGRAEAETVRLFGVRLDLPGLGPLPAFDARIRPGPPLVATAPLPGGGRAELRVVQRGDRKADLSLSVAGAVVEDERLAHGPVGPLGLTLGGLLSWDATAGGAALSQGRLAIGPGAVASLTLSAVARPEPHGMLSIRAERLDWAALGAALPAQLRPAPAAPRVAGTVSFRLALAGPPARPGEWRLDASLDLSGLHPDGPVALLEPLDWRAPESAGLARTLHLGPGSGSWVPLDDVPARVTGAVLLGEDAGFMTHRGFDFSEIREALAERAGSGRARGASTLTQQLAKNLYLSGERTLARKIREALATVALEASVPKRRLLELYLNMAEWGPGLFGIGEASRHYFDVEPRQLSAKQAAFLASIIPSPVRFHGYFTRGALTEHFEERVRALLAKMYATDLVSEAEFLEALETPLAFARPSADVAATVQPGEPEGPALP